MRSAPQLVGELSLRAVWKSKDSPPLLLRPVHDDPYGLDRRALTWRRRGSCRDRCPWYTDGTTSVTAWRTRGRVNGHAPRVHGKESNLAGRPPTGPWMEDEVVCELECEGVHEL